ncbi:MAG: DNA-3-methyladenine glycosylase I [Armatimonadetes bacterium]|nr:DNA-3-methyladenine glycosylase I [Armatimonadota bacterium]
MKAAEKRRCEWCETNELYLAYHDTEWGVPLHDDRKLFELLTLEGAQAGLSWLTILKRRDGYREAFCGFDPVIVARFDDQKVTELLSCPAIIRNRLKVTSATQNARAVLKVQQEFGSFDGYVWQFVNNTPVQHRYVTLAEMPATDSVAKAMSKDMQSRGFAFVGATICYALMQACGMVNDHLITCFRHAEVQQTRFE